MPQLLIAQSPQNQKLCAVAGTPSVRAAGAGPPGPRLRARRARGVFRSCGPRPRRARPCVELDPPAVRALATRRDAEAQGLSNVGLEPSYIHTASRETHVHATRHKHKPSCEHLFSIRIPARAAAQGSSRSARSVAWLATLSIADSWSSGVSARADQEHPARLTKIDTKIAAQMVVASKPSLKTLMPSRMVCSPRVKHLCMLSVPKYECTPQRQPLARRTHRMQRDRVHAQVRVLGANRARGLVVEEEAPHDAPLSRIGHASAHAPVTIKEPSQLVGCRPRDDAMEGGDTPRVEASALRKCASTVRRCVSIGGRGCGEQIEGCRRMGGGCAPA